MLPSIPRRLLARGAVYSNQCLSASRASIRPSRRNFALTSQRRIDDPSKPISDYIASQPPQSNPEIPADCMPHQTEENIASEKIFGDKPSTGNEDGLPSEGVPVEDVIKENPETMEKAPRVIKDGKKPRSARPNLRAQTGSKDQDVPGHSGLPHVSEENIAYERILSGDKASGARNSAAGEETPATGVPIEEVMGDGEKPAVMESSESGGEPPSGGQALPNDTAEEITDESAESTRKSILDLFGAPTNKKFSRSTTPRSPRSESRSNHNPLSSHGLDSTAFDLSAWEASRANEVKQNIDSDPEEWADSQRGIWETEETTEEIHDDGPDPRIIAIQERFRGIQRKPDEKEPVPYDLQLPQTESIPSSPWDYFYPPPPPPKSLSSAIRQEHESRHPDQRQKLSTESYDPYANKQKQQKWPFLYNRDELVHLCVNHMMRHGKKATAEKIMQQVFFRLMNHFPRRHPVTVLAEAVDKNAPILKNSGMRIGVKTIVKPFALNERQRIRAGWMVMVLAAANEGKNAEVKIPFSERLTAEIIKTMEGRGAGAAVRRAEHKTAMMHKLGVQVPKRVKV